MVVSLPPLRAVQETGRRYPDIWKQIDEVRGIGVEFGYRWDEKICYCPITIAIGALTGRQGMSRADASGLGGLVAALAAWRREKRVYRFDPDLAAEVMASADDLVIPTEVLRQMPASCLYIQAGGVDESGSDGFFAWVEQDVENDRQELRLLFLDADGRMVTQYMVHLMPGGTIKDGVDAAQREMRRNASALESEGVDRSMLELAIPGSDEARGTIVRAVQLVLYICAENADIRENEDQKRVYRRCASVSDKFREVRQWDVGDDLGWQIRMIRSRRSSRTGNGPVNLTETEAGDSEIGSGSPRRYKNRPHLRRAHWHHYWVGEGRRKIVLKWINTMIVNAEDGEIGVTVQIVEKEEEQCY